MAKRDQEWVSTTVMTQALGIHRDTLLRLKGEIFTQGKHWRVKNPLSFRKTYLWNHAHVLKTWNDETSHIS
jgi:hypothetical protein